MRILGYVKQVGSIQADIVDPTMVTLDMVEASPIRCPIPERAAEMIALIEQVRKDQDSIGGVCELVATGVPAGLGEPVFDKLKADLAKALLSLPAVMAFEYGAGFGVATARGSDNNDPFIRTAAGKIGTQGNRSMAACSAASAAVGRSCACRHHQADQQASSRPQPTVTAPASQPEIGTKGRHDPCLLPRFVPMGSDVRAGVGGIPRLRLRAQCG